jgi:hypothetical protein
MDDKAGSGSGPEKKKKRNFGSTIVQYYWFILFNGLLEVIAK